MADYLLLGFFTASKTGKTGLTVTVDVRKVSDNTLVVNNASAAEHGGGLYKYTYTGAEDDYTAVFKTTDITVDAQHVAALASVVLPRIDAAITTRLAAGDYAAAPSAANVADAVWDEELEETITLRQALRVILAVLAGKSGGGGTTTITFRDVADATNRVTATVDANGNRTAIILDLA